MKNNLSGFNLKILLMNVQLYDFKCATITLLFSFSRNTVTVKVAVDCMKRIPYLINCITISQQFYVIIQ